MAARVKKVPQANEVTKDIPNITNTTKEVPEVVAKIKQPPQVGNPENTVKIGDTMVEIKPTKLRYQRDRTAAFYHILDVYPLIDIFAMDAGAFGDERDGDKCVLDWLVAVTDNPELVTAHYNDINTDTIERMVSIFKRVNRIDEKEEKRKNLQKQKGVMS